MIVKCFRSFNICRKSLTDFLNRAEKYSIYTTLKASGLEKANDKALYIIKEKLQKQTGDYIDWLVLNFYNLTYIDIKPVYRGYKIKYKTVTEEGVKICHIIL